MYKVYKIVNLINNKIYIGCTQETLECRWKRHLIKCNQKKYCTSLLKAINKYGSDNFKIELIQKYDSRQAMLDGEIEWISYYNSYKSNNGYNETPGGDGGPTNLGKKFDKEHVLKISQAQIGSERKSTRRFSNEIEKEICFKYLKGSSGYALAKEYKCTRSLIYTIFKRQGVKKRDSNYIGHNNRTNIFSKKEELEICELYNTGNYTISELSLKFKCKVRDILLRNNSLKRINK